MKRFVLLLFIAMMIMSVTCSAARVRLYDGSVDGFANGYSSKQGVFSSNFNVNLAITKGPTPYIGYDNRHVLEISKGSSKVYVNLFPSTNGVFHI